VVDGPDESSRATSEVRLTQHLTQRKLYGNLQSASGKYEVAFHGMVIPEPVRVRALS
jgi:hypothetical protein